MTQKSSYCISNYGATFSELISQNSSTLQDITLLNAWEHTRRGEAETEPPWMSDMPSRQLYISDPRTWSGPIFNGPRWRLLGHLIREELDLNWGKGIRHVRIDQLELDEQKLDTFLKDRTVDKFSQLKILVLRSLPEQVRYVPPSQVSLPQGQNVPSRTNVLRSTPYPHLPFGPTLPKDIADVREGLLALKIAAQDLPSLLVIVVDEFKFWLQRVVKGSDHDHDNGKPKVRFLRHALEDPIQEAIIFQTMDKYDWDFLADREDCLPEEAPKEQVHWANRMVCRPEIKKAEEESG